MRLRINASCVVTSATLYNHLSKLRLLIDYARSREALEMVMNWGLEYKYIRMYSEVKQR